MSDDLHLIKIGHGFDLHRLTVGRKLILSGVDIPFEKGCDGHSDADVLIHAIIDALLGALALGDIGSWFPDTDQQYKNANSRTLLKHVYQDIVTKHKHELHNLDSTIIIEKPKLRNYIEQMRQNIAHDLNVDISQISIKAKTSEGVGIVGSGEAVVAHSVVLLKRYKNA